MTAIFNVTNPNYEGLQNYILGGKRSAPTDVPRQLAPSARQPNNTPTEQPSAGRRPIPTSSQRPWQPTNQRIPYARHFFKNDEEIRDRDTARPWSIEPGDVAFVHKTSNSLGKDINRCVRVMGIPQLNKRLENHQAGHTTINFSNPGEMGAKIRAVREAAARSKLEDHLRGNQRSTNADKALEYDQEVKDYEEKITAVATTPASSLNDVNHQEDWRALTFLTDFTPDGVVIGKDDGQNDCLYNICIAGPTPIRNTTAKVETVLDTPPPPQIIDSNATVLDNVFVGLFKKENGGTMSFYYKLFTGRQAYKFQTNPMRPDLCTAWRIGTIMDTKRVGNLGNGTQHLFINVVIEEWSFEKIDTAYNNDSAKAPAPAPAFNLDAMNEALQVLKGYKESSESREAVIETLQGEYLNTKKDVDKLLDCGEAPPELREYWQGRLEFIIGDEQTDTAIKQEDPDYENATKAWWRKFNKECIQPIIDKTDDWQFAYKIALQRDDVQEFVVYFSKKPTF